MTKNTPKNTQKSNLTKEKAPKNPKKASTMKKNDKNQENLPINVLSLLKDNTSELNSPPISSPIVDSPQNASHSNVFSNFLSQNSRKVNFLTEKSPSLIPSPMNVKENNPNEGFQIRIEKKVDKILELLEDNYFSNFENKFMEEHGDFLKSFMDFDCLHPNVDAILTKMIEQDLIPERLSDTKFKKKIQKCINNKITTIRSNFIRYAREIWRKKKTFLTGIEDMKIYLGKDTTIDPTQDELYFASLYVQNTKSKTDMPLESIQRMLMDFKAMSGMQKQEILEETIKKIYDNQNGFLFK